MTRTQGKAGTFAALVAVLAVAAGCGKSADDVNAPATTGGSDTAAATGTGAAPTDQQSITSPAPTGDVSDPLVWGVYRETNTLDPIFAFDYPENTVLFNMCEAVLKQAPDGSIGSGLGDVANPDPTTFVITLKDGVTFWDGKPLTADDVVFSLGRARDAEARRLLPAGVRAGEGHQGDRTARGHGHDDRARLLVPQRAVRPGGRRRSRRRSSRRGREVRHRRRRHHVQRPVQARLVEDGRGRHDRARTTPTGIRPAPARSRR